MKYMLEAVLELPRNKVIELFTNPDNLPRWQPSLTSFEPLSGTPGQKGAKLRLKHKMGGRIIEMTETIETESLPEEVTYSYEAKGAWNRAVNRFLEHSPGVNPIGWTVTGLKLECPPGWLN